MEEPNVRSSQRSASDYHERIAEPESNAAPSQAEKAAAARRQHGDELTAISDGLVALLKEFYGRGPTLSLVLTTRMISSSASFAAAIPRSSRRFGKAAAARP